MMTEEKETKQTTMDVFMETLTSLQDTGRAFQEGYQMQAVIIRELSSMQVTAPKPFQWNKMWRWEK
jgi:hypothetical protein